MPLWRLATAALGVMALLLCLLAIPAKAMAYADPGTGAFVYQAVYAGFLAGAFYLRKFLNRFKGKKKKAEDVPAAAVSTSVADR